MGLCCHCYFSQWQTFGLIFFWFIFFYQIWLPRRNQMIKWEACYVLFTMIYEHSWHMIWFFTHNGIKLEISSRKSCLVNSQVFGHWTAYLNNSWMQEEVRNRKSILNWIKLKHNISEFAGYSKNLSWNRMVSNNDHIFEFKRLQKGQMTSERTKQRR